MPKAYRVVIPLALIVLCLMVGMVWVFNKPDSTPEPLPPQDVAAQMIAQWESPVARPAQGYAGSDSCRTCHPAQFASWQASYHRTMTQVATPETVVGNFQDVQLTLAGFQFHLHRRGDQFWVEMPDFEQISDTGWAPPVQRRIVQLTGSHHMQVYWYTTGESRRLGQLPFVYLIDEARWVADAHSFLEPPGGSLPTDGTWNYVCISCHTTGPRPGFQWTAQEDPQQGNAFHVQTEVSEFGIACEACHGPGEKHRQFHEAGSGTEAESGLVVPNDLDPHRSSQVCGQCHSVWSLKGVQPYVDWSKHGFAYRPGDDLEQTGRWILRYDSPHPEAVQELEQFPAETVVWPDGMIRVSGREYNGLLDSPCYQHQDTERKLSCFSCHSMHADPDTDLSSWADDQLRPGMRTSHACRQCHPQFNDPSTLAAHTHHAAESTGSQCMNCHMPYTTYGLLKAIRSHQISSPSVSESLDTGRPNACNQCHLDRTLQWTADALRQWYEIESPPLNEDQQSIAASVLWTLRGDAGQRALMAWSLGWPPARETAGSDWMTPYISQLMGDDYGAVRIIAYRSLQQDPEYASFAFDPEAPASERVAALQQLAVRFAERFAGRRSTQHQLLFLDDGSLDLALFNRLLLERDQRPVRLQE